MTHLPPATSGTLRERFVADMAVRGFTEKTRKDYLRTVAGFATFLERSPGTATAEDIRRFQIQQSEQGMNAPTMNSAVAALRFFFNHPRPAGPRPQADPPAPPAQAPGRAQPRRGRPPDRGHDLPQAPGRALGGIRRRSARR